MGVRGGLSVDLLCSRNARPEKEWRTGVRSFLCSRNAHDQNVLVRRPQSKVPHSRAWVALKVKRAMSGRAQWEIKQTTPPVKRNEQAWKEHDSGRSTRAVKGTRALPFGRGGERRWSVDLLCSRNTLGLVYLVGRPVFLVCLVVLNEFPVRSTNQTR